MVKPTTKKAYCKLVNRDVEASRVSIPTGHGQVIRQSECRNFQDKKPNHDPAKSIRCPEHGKPGCVLN